MDEAEAGRERGSGGGKYRVILRERKRMGGQGKSFQLHNSVLLWDNMFIWASATDMQCCL
ncbi:hypothetical protein Q5P01_017214 [Channa striata]|uniref:Uncharacterized protein n=1 Tax=Channa striata TaxID=64152 RepID=A0AA88M945_CHASR|nr:hypothetical protein Q5P01_017214 [Channa striata]